MRTRRPAIRFAILPLLVTMAAGAAFDPPQEDSDFPPRIPIARTSDLADLRATLPPSVRGRRLNGGDWQCTFSYKPSSGVEEVSLAGDFNGWNPRATPSVHAV